jgi:hypothetical protein
MTAKKITYATFLLLIAEWILFKLAYPYPDVFADSYFYISAAHDHLDINLWPIGYSKFLALFHGITHSATALVTFQFFALEFAAWYLYSFLKAHLSLKGASATIVYVFFFVNPLLLYQSNTVTSDALFATLSLLWLTELLRFMTQPVSFWRLWPQAVLIGIAYTFRYTAMYYPIISALALIVSPNATWKKVTGSLLFLLFVIPFLLYSREAGKRLTGVPMYSILSGWQIGNNVMQMRGEIRIDTAQLPSRACVRLDTMSQAYFDKAGPHFQDYLDGFVGNFFIEGPWNAPLKKYMIATYGRGTFREWGLAGLTFTKYGQYIIRHYPFAYLRYFIIPNAKFYFAPPLSDIERYNGGSEFVGKDMQSWFGYKSQKTPVISTSLQGRVLPLPKKKIPVLYSPGQMYPPGRSLPADKRRFLDPCQPRLSPLRDRPHARLLGLLRDPF